MNNLICEINGPTTAITNPMSTMMSVTISLKPNDADAYYYRGIDWEKLGNTDGAIADYTGTL